MCKSTGKLWGNYFETQGTQDFLEELATNLGKDIRYLVESKKGGVAQGTWVHPQVADHLRHWCRGKRKRTASGYVYTATSSHLNAVKIGMWRGSVSSLRTRYLTPYGSSLQLTVFPVNDCIKSEANLHQQFAEFSLDGELFCKSQLAAYLQAMENMQG